MAYPDPTGVQRRTSAAGATDHGIIRKYGMQVVSPKAPWSVKDRIQATNYLIRNANDELRLFVHPRCKDTIKGLKSVTFKEGSEDFIVNKDPGLEHWTDALGYLICQPRTKSAPGRLGPPRAEGPGLVIRTRRDPLESWCSRCVVGELGKRP